MIMDNLMATVQFKRGKLKAMERFKPDWEPFIECWNKKETNTNTNMYKWVVNLG